jgi:hypothetical protein
MVKGDIKRRGSGSVSDIWYAPILNERRLSVRPQAAEQRAGAPGRDAARRTARRPFNAAWRYHVSSDVTTISGVSVNIWIEPR